MENEVSSPLCKLCHFSFNRACDKLSNDANYLYVSVLIFAVSEDLY